MRFEFLKFLGWNEHFESHFSNGPNLFPARVIAEERESYRLQIGPERIIDAEVTGRLRYTAESRIDFPAVGDWVEAQPADEGFAIIHRILPRTSCLLRTMAGTQADVQVMATNVDWVLVATSLNQDLNLRRLERFLVAIREGQAKPVIVLTKSDLVDDARAAIEQVESIAAGAPVHCLSSLSGEGIAAIMPYVRAGETAILIGSSGVGKSTLLNRLLGSSVAKTQAIRGDDDRGRHTTTSRFLYRLETGGLLIDSPGVREFGLAGADEGLGSTFSDIETLARQCRFGDCAHASEPGCAIRGALTGGMLVADRWESYQKLQRELAFEHRKADRAAAAAEKAKWKKIHVDQRVKQRLKGR